ncbi:MAG TPA: ATP-grasp domain-containing protein [Terriglobales bacterium]|nr:ATP-grasp domain-containing protein [Terriglobales bacterium]
MNGPITTRVEGAKPKAVSVTKVLLTDTNRWSLSARLAIGLAEAGCQVSAICVTPGHALLKTKAVHGTFSYSGLRPLESLTHAIEATEPDIIIPCCDRSVGHLHELYARAKESGAAGNKLMALIERSLGPEASYSVVSSRNDLLAIAREEGVRVPTTARVDTPEDLITWQARESFPWVLKADGTWGGGGVKIVHSADEIQHSFTQLARMFRFRRAVKRLFVNRDPFGIRSWWKRSQYDVIVQSYIPGHPANCAVVCWKGRVLAGLGVEVVLSDGLTGPASIVRVVDNAEMMFAAERIAGRLGLSGFFGLDFMIEEGSGAAYLIEMNPRTTPLCHLRLGTGRDMPGALWAQLTGQPSPNLPPVTQNELIAYFPQAWNTRSELLHSSFQDIPQSEPALVEELLRPWPDRTLLFRLFNRMGRKAESAANHGLNQSVKKKTTNNQPPSNPSPAPTL